MEAFAVNKITLSCLAAHHIMNWKYLEFTRDDDSKFIQFMGPDGYESDYIKSRNPIEVQGGDEGNAPDFASDPAASKRLRDKMRADGWKSCLSSTDTFTMRYWGYRKGQDTVEAHADTEELSCLIAALRAVGAISGEVEVTE